jgi:serine/threonine protein kinase
VSAHYENFGKYVLLEKLATGGMAEVFLARGTGAGGIGKFFAIKRILPQYADSPEFIDMFKDEAKIAINLSHSNIVSIHEFGVEKGQFFLVMDYVEGRNLRQILNKMKKSGLQFSVEQIVFIVKEVAGGLDHAHRCIDGSTGRPLNITHRDMSPQNIMVSFEGETKIVDFGIAKAESQIETTRAGTLKGKFGYMSPEQAEGQAVDLRTDIFSLGIVLWELLAHDRLFVANNEINTLRKIRDCQIPSLRKINPNIHTELERISQKSLARDRNLRYQTGAALHRDLNRFLNRQYPDFSAQDFSVFIKSVFADEILSLRKRLVDYAQVNLTIDLTIPKASKDFDDRTSLLDSNTNSLVVSDSSISKDESSLVNVTSPDMNAETRAKKESTKATAPSLEISDLTTTDPLLKRTNMEDSTRVARANPTGLLDDSAIAAEMVQTRENGGGRSKVAPMEPSSKDAPPPKPPEAKILNTGKILVNAPVELGTEEVSSPDIRQHIRKARSDNPRSEYLPAATNAPKPARFATLIVFCLLCVSVYAYLVKYFNPMMCDVISNTHSFAAPLHTALGVEPCGSRNSASSSVPNPVPANTSASPIPLGDPNAIIVTSNPSGAEIWRNGVSTGMVTPSKVQVPGDGPFSIELRKRGYQTYKRLDVTVATIGHKMDATLQKMNIGYLDVEIFPPQEAILFVGGRQINLQRTQAKDILVPANIPIKVRAESRGSNTFEEVTISVPLDRKRTIKLNPRKNARLPAAE